MDLFLRGVLFSALRLVAALLVVIGFCLMMLPDTWNLPIHKLFGWTSYSKCYNGEQQQTDEDGEPIGEETQHTQGLLQT